MSKSIYCSILILPIGLATPQVFEPVLVSAATKPLRTLFLSLSFISSTSYENFLREKERIGALIWSLLNLTSSPMNFNNEQDDKIRSQN